MTGVMTDLRIAFRRALRRPTYSLTVILTIAIGIGAASAIYSVVDSVVIRAPAFRESDRLVAIWQTAPEWKSNKALAANWDHVGMSVPQVRQLIAAGGPLQKLGAWSESSAALTVGTLGNPEYVRVIAATATFLEVLGTTPLLGRNFTQAEDRPGAERTALISEGLWRRSFGGSAAVLGRTVTLDDVPFSIVGVLPSTLTVDRREDALQYAAGGPVSVDVWTPVGLDAEGSNDWRRENLKVVGRLRDGASHTDVTKFISLTASNTDLSDARGVNVQDFQQDQTRDVRLSMLMLLGAVLTLLIVACANVALLTVNESMASGLELSVRAALGGSRSALFRQLLTESFVLASVGGIVGLVFATFATAALVAIAPKSMPGLTDVHLSYRTVIFASICMVGTTFAFGLWPAIKGSNPHFSTMLRSGKGQSERGRSVLQHSMIALEFSASLILLIGSGLFVLSLRKLNDAHLGFDPQDIVAVQLVLPRQLWGDTANTRRLYREVTRELARIPGVQSATAISQAPFMGGTSGALYILEQEKLAGGKPAGRPIQLRSIVPRYFTAMKIRMLEGREFESTDNAAAEPVVIVSQATTIRDFANTSALNQRIYFQGKMRRVVGIVDDVRSGMVVAGSEPTIYIPFEQGRSWILSPVVRVRGSPERIMTPIREAIARAAPLFAVKSVNSMSAAIRESSSPQRYRAVLLTVFASTATLLACIGMYGVTSRAVVHRTREFAIRRALGATSYSIALNALRPTATAILLGSILGETVAFFLAQNMQSLLFSTTSHNPRIFIAACAVLITITSAATLLPIVRLQKQEVSKALRES